MAVRTRTKTEPSVKGGDARIEEYLEKKGITFAFRENVGVEEFDVERSMRNQVRFEPVKPAKVEEYTEAMRRGDVFPPSVVQKVAGKYVNVDGNHRLQAAMKSHSKLRVYDITGADPGVITLIAFQFNTTHGEPTSEQERVHQALYLIETHASTVAAAAAALNLPKRIVDKALQRAQTDARFTENQIPLGTIDKLSEFNRWRLSQVITDEGFVAAVDLVVSAKLAQDQILDLVTRVNTVKSSAKQVQMIKDMRADMLGTIQAAGGGVFGSKNNGKRVIGPRMRLGGALTNLEALPEDVEAAARMYVGEERELVAKRAREGAKRLNALARALVATEPAPAAADAPTA